MMMMLKVFLLSLCFVVVRSFNLDTDRPTVLSGPPGSHFGFSVAFHRANVLIGAPRANVTSDWTASSSLVQHGAVYGCPWRPDSSCQPIAFHMTEDRIGQQVEFTSNQWFGATVRSNGHHILACAPLYHWSGVSRSDRDPVGRCLIKTPTHTVEYAPCRTASSGPEGQGFCQAGFSADFVKNTRVVLGGPGSYYWQGQLISDDLSEIFSGSSRTLLSSYQKQRSTRPAGAEQDDSYLGYAVAVGDFNNDGEEDFATGVPRGNKSVGYVTILNGLNMEAMINLTGSQVAAYFGHSVAATDINSDGLIDVLVGAPLFIERGSDGKLREVGQVCVFLGEGVFSFRPSQCLLGWETFGRFGLAISSLGDLDLDGFKDVAVAAPYGGDHSRGTVYIYRGQTNGLHLNPSQALEGRWASSSMSPSFGFSLRGEHDVDDNGYPDLLVGAFGADRAILYRSRPVVVLKVNLELQPQIIDSQKKSCRLETGYNVSCFTVKYCFQTTGQRIPDLITLVFQVILDVSLQSRVLFLHSQSASRVLFLHSQSASYRKKTTVRTNERPACEELTAYLRGESEFRDKVSPVRVMLVNSLEDKRTSDRKELTPVLHQDTPLNTTRQAHILLDCGIDNICTPNLHLTVQSDRQRMYFGDDNALTLLVAVENKGEGAYEAELRVNLPPHAHFTGTVSNQSLSRLPCVYQRLNLSRAVVCDLGNPLEANTKITTGLMFTLHQLSDEQTSIQFDLQIISSNQYAGTSQVVSSVTKLAVQADVEIRGVSAPDQIFLPIANWSPQHPPLVENHIGPLIQHIYELRNNGPSVFSQAILDISVPYRHGNTSLLYITSLETDGPMSCDSTPPLETFKLTGGGTPDDNNSSTHDLGEEGRSHSNHIHRRALDLQAAVLDCGGGACLKVRCFVRTMKRGERAVLLIRSRLDVASLLLPEKINHPLVIRSEGKFTVIQLPYKLPAHLPSDVTTVETSVLWLVPNGPPVLPLWAVVLAVLAGLLLLVLLSYGMYKAGYFNRVRPPLAEDGTEKEQLQPQNGETET